MRFAGFEYSRKRGELRLYGKLVPLQEQPLRLLELLLENSGEIVSRERIQKRLWDQSYGDHEHGINTAIRKVRKVLNLAGSSELRVVTNAGRGYRLLLPTENTHAESKPVTPPSGNLLQEPPILDPAGEEAFVTGRFLFSQRKPESLLDAKAKFEIACERNPNHALAHASLSRTCRFLTIFEMASPQPLWQQAEHHARRAVELDASLSEAQSSLACVLARYCWKWTEGCVIYQEALRLNPNDVETICDYGVALLAMGNAEEGARQLERVLLLDPRYAVGRATVALGWLMQGRKSAAVAMLKGMTAAMPDFVTAWIYLGIEQLNTAQWLEAEQSCKRMLQLAPDNPTFLALLAHAQAGLDWKDALDTTILRLNKLGRQRYVSPTAAAMAALAAGDAASACTAIRETVLQRDANFALYRKMRLFDPVRSTPDFVQALAAMRL